jgi:hypothetical protein
VLALLATVPESLPLADHQSAERIQAAIVLGSQGDLTRFRSWLDLACADWRDALLGAGLGNEDWQRILYDRVGPAL